MICFQRMEWSVYLSWYYVANRSPANSSSPISFTSRHRWLPLLIIFEEKEQSHKQSQFEASFVSRRLGRSKNFAINSKKPKNSADSKRVSRTFNLRTRGSCIVPVCPLLERKRGDTDSIRKASRNFLCPSSPSSYFPHPLLTFQASTYCKIYCEKQRVQLEGSFSS